MRNEGLWTLATNGTEVSGTSGDPDLERFVNHGTLRSTVTGGGAATIYNTVTLDSYGQVEVTDNSTLYVYRPGIWFEESPR